MIRRRAPIARSSKPLKRTGRIRGLSPAKYGSHKQRVKYANELWRKLIYRKSPTGLCLRCNLRPLHDAMHIFIKGAYPSLRFDLENGIPGCRACHRRIDSDHLAKEELAIRVLGDERYRLLELRAQTVHKQDMALVILQLEATHAALVKESEGR